jgi:plastocyanin
MSHWIIVRATLRLPAALLFVLAIAAFAAGCGGSDSDDGDPTPTAARTSPSPAASRTAPAAASPTAGAADATVTSSVPVPPAPSREPPQTTPPVQPTSAPPAPPPPTVPPPPPPPGTSITISAFNALAFSPASATAPANASVNLTFDNQDPAVLHDLKLLSPSGTTLAHTDVFEGIAQRTVTFTTGAPGSYPFICTVHPQDMRGTLVVQ